MKATATRVGAKLGSANSIGRRMAVQIIAFSSALMLVISSVQLVLEYKDLRAGLDAELDRVDVYLGNISGCVWNFDEKQIQLALEGLIRLPNIEHAAVAAADTGQVWVAGVAPTKNPLTRSYELRHAVNGRETLIGRLSVTAGLDALRWQIIEHAIAIVISNGLKAFFVALFILYLFRRLVTNRLEMIATKLRRLGPESDEPRLSTGQVAPLPPDGIDELDVVEWSLDSTAGQLRRASHELVASHAALQESEARLRQALDAADLGIFDWDVALGLITWTRRLEALWGLAPGEFDGTYAGFARSVHPDDLSGVEVAIARCIAAREPFSREFRVVWPDGSVHWVTSMGRFEFDDAGQALRMRGVVQEVTARKRDEEQIRQLNASLELRVLERTVELEDARFQADKANLAKSAFLANMSHEIRTPMNAVIGLTHLLRRGSPTAGQAEKLDKIDVAGRHLMSIINDVLDISKIESGQLTLDSADFHLSAILDHIHSIIGEQARAKGLKVEIDPDSVPMWLRGDETRLRQALLNYAGNAVKFTETGTIWLRAILLAEHDGELLVRFEVQDTGIGIATDQMSRLFADFEQADASITRMYGGTGLGLAITRRLAAAMGGESGVDSSLGVGSTFWFTTRLQRGHGVLPEEPEVIDLDAESTLRSRHAAALILLVEDNPINREVALELLHSVGLSADSAENGQVAVEMVTAKRYDLILMDMQMPVMDGLAATRVIRALPGGHDTPIVAMTANAFEEDRQACAEAGMAEFITKPVEPAALFRKLATWLPNTDADTRAAKPSTLARRADRSVRPETADLIAAIGVIPGVDAGSGLDALNGDGPRYTALLKQLAANAGDAMDGLRQALDRLDRERIRHLAHSISGSSAMLSAVSLHARAAELESAVRSTTSPGDLQVLLSRLESEHAAFATAVATLPLPPVTAKPAGAVDPAERSRVLDHFARLLGSRDTQASIYLDEFNRVMSDMPRLAQDIIEINRLVARFDYISAGRILESLALD